MIVLLRYCYYSIARYEEGEEGKKIASNLQPPKVVEKDVNIVHTYRLVLISFLVATTRGIRVVCTIRRTDRRRRLVRKALEKDIAEK